MGATKSLKKTQQKREKAPAKKAPAKKAEPPPKFFETLPAWRSWLAKHHADHAELWVGFKKRGTGHPSITWPESVDGALAYGWIDGLRKGIDEHSYKIRFTPRKKGSIWSAVNLRRMRELIDGGQAHSAGIAVFEARDLKKAGRYSFEQKEAPALSPEEDGRFRQEKEAHRWFTARAPSYQKAAVWWVVSAKQASTRARRLKTLIEDSAAGRTIKPLSWNKKDPKPR
ncbi:MAG: YdeI/OmpD-associated family protein [Myxococcota bacterium]